ncbi:hypothetical protein SAMN02800694_1743 [Luteibacter sp. UNCMF331Sha3.1]|uniref:hypothetical protein n=1 Tax=Luteibacter sp. UNCMF331Sha3.1 TaxID=1502760 RepID=UPI0008C03A5A|nr:hypothetical protein [Luteibacter sp. UNCMF331Sha3.1]SEM79953.1 hypothetical protein SAMN02800694_1743 [Luteibacter sp. UNCMF331Sha3.1]
MHVAVKAFVALIVAGVAAHASAQRQRPEQALGYINAEADYICTKVATGGSSSSFKGSAEVEVSLSRLFRKLAKAGVDGKIGYESEAHDGVLAHQVLDAAKEGNDCRKHVFDVLSAYFFPPQARVIQKTSGRNSPVIETMNGGTINIGR